MPIYAYRCTSCGHAKDVLQKVSDPLLTDCPACGAATFVKQVTAAGFQLKGSGWYVTDFRSNGAAAAPKDGQDGQDGKKADAATAGGGKTEAPAAAPAPSEAAKPSAAAPATPSATPAAGG